MSQAKSELASISKQSAVFADPIFSDGFALTAMHAAAAASAATAAATMASGNIPIFLEDFWRLWSFMHGCGRRGHEKKMGKKQFDFPRQGFEPQILNKFFLRICII